jgi:ACS family hexuronate transporter-like MFS transporter
MSRYQVRLLTLLCLSTVINYVDRQALAVVVPTLRADLNLTATAYADVTTLFLIAYTIGQAALGYWIDRVGTRTGFVASIALWSFAGIAHAFTNGVASLAICRILLGLGEAGNWPAGVKAIAEWFPKEKRAFSMAIFDGGSAIGAVLAPPLVAYLALTMGWRAAFILTGTLGLIWMAFWHTTYRDPAPLSAAATVNQRPSLRQLFAVRQLWGLMLTRMLATPVWWFYVFWLPDYFNKGRGFGLKEIGMFLWLPYLTVDLGKLIGGRLSDHLLTQGHSATFARKSVMAAGALCMTAGLFVVDASTANLALLWVSIATFGFGLWSANILALHADVFPSHWMASAIGWTGMAASLGGAAFTWAIGRAVDQYGYGPVFVAVGSSACLAFLALIFTVGKIPNKQQAHA